MQAALNTRLLVQWMVLTASFCPSHADTVGVPPTPTAAAGLPLPVGLLPPQPTLHRLVAGEEREGTGGGQPSAND